MENSDVRRFITKQVLKDIEKFEHEGKVVTHRSMMYFPSVIKLIFPDLGITARSIIKLYYQSITFASEYEYFYKFSETFPVEFQEFYTPKIQWIRKHIKELLFEDIEYYLEEDGGQVGPELDVLLNVTIQDLSKSYGIKITKKFVHDIESAFDINLSYLLKKKKIGGSKASKTKPEEFKDLYTPKLYESIIDEYLPSEEESYDPVSFLKEQGYNQYITEIKDNKSALSRFKDCQLLFEEVCHFFVHNGIAIKTINTYRIIDLYCDYYSRNINVDSQLLVSFFYQVIQELNQSSSYCTTKSKLNLILKRCNLTQLGIEKLSPIIIPEKNWFKFSASVLKKYIIVQYISSGKDERDFKDQLIDICIEEPYDYEILSFLEMIDKKRLREQFLFPELSRLVENIDFTNEKTKAQSFINFFDIDFDLKWNKKNKTFDTWGSSCSESHFENMLSFLNIEFYTSDFETYFEEQYQDETTVSRLSINAEIVRKLKNIVLKTIDQKNRKSFISDNSETVFEVKLSSFLQEESTYQIAEEVGMTDYINKLIQRIIVCKNNFIND